jgi:hypothetical protein
MDNAQNCDSYINIPSSQTYLSFLSLCFYLKLKKYLEKTLEDRKSLLCVATVTVDPEIISPSVSFRTTGECVTGNHKGVKLINIHHSPFLSILFLCNLYKRKRHQIFICVGLV